MSEYDRQRDIEAERQRAAIYHRQPVLRSRVREAVDRIDRLLANAGEGRWHPEQTVTIRTDDARALSVAVTAPTRAAPGDPVRVEYGPTIARLTVAGVEVKFRDVKDLDAHIIFEGLAARLRTALTKHYAPEVPRG